MKNFLKSLVKAFLIALVGREAMATSLITMDKCPSTSYDHNSIDGGILMEKYHVKHSADRFTMDDTLWQMNAYKFEGIPQLANSTYKFVNVSLDLAHPLLTCRYDCKNPKECKPYFEELEIISGADIDKKIPWNTPTLIRAGLWNTNKQQPGNIYNCNLKDGEHLATDDCGFKFAANT